MLALSPISKIRQDFRTLFGFYGGQDGGHPAAFHARGLVYLGHVLERLDEPFEHGHTLFFVDDVPSSKLHVGPYFIAFFEEFAGVLRLEVEVVRVGAGAKTNLFELRVMLTFSRFFLFLLLLIEKLAEVHNLTDRRLGVGCNFDEVEILFRSHFEGFLNRVDPVFTLGVYNPDLRGADVFVDARSSSFSDGGVSLLVRHVSKVAVPKDSYNITHEPLVWSIPLRGFRGGCD